VEGNFVARFGTAGLDPVQVLLGASSWGRSWPLPLALMTGQWISPLPPWGAPDLAIVGSSVAHALAYAGYVWMVGRAGAVFAAQVSYLVTAFGIFWAWLISARPIRLGLGRRRADVRGPLPRAAPPCGARDQAA
jgi:drug/metabolite transporter (DMT)-like permease